MNFETNTQTYAVASAQSVDRARFIRNTYTHVAGATLALVALEAVILNSPLGQTIASTLLGGRWTWLIVIGLFMVVSTVANRWAMSDTSRSTQYWGLGLFVVAQAVILAPLLYVAQRFAGNDIIAKAGMVTAGLFLGLTAIVFMTKKDFSFMRSALTIGGFVALGLIVAGMIFGFNLGLWFTGAMILLMAGTILYSTSNVLHHYRTDQYVGASLALFSSLATLFWYVLQFFMSFGDD